MNDAEHSIRSIIEAWVVWRDAGAWDELRSTWHDDGRIRTTWFEGSARDFVEAARTGFEGGVMAHHFLGGTQVHVNGHRAIAQTKMTISQRLDLEGAEVDVTCTGRFYDFFEQRDGAWRIVLREPVYERDRLDPVAPGQPVSIDKTRLDTFPYGCRHLLYCQEATGMAIRTTVPGLHGPAVEALYSSGRRWLQGEPIDR